MSGLLAMVVISYSIIWIDQITLLFPLFYMFASSSLLSSFKKKQKQETEKVLSKSGPRDYVQALANLGVATAFILVYNFFGDPIWIVAMVGSVAAGNADSWASEIGVLSKKQPVSILHFKVMPPGISGGVTLLGSFAGLVGSFFIAAASVFTIQALDPVSLPIIPVLFTTGLAGFFGMLFDSFMGVLWQALYQEPHTLGLTENADGNRLIKGFSWMNNDMVNFLSTLFGGVAAVLIYWLALYFQMAESS